MKKLIKQKEIAASAETLYTKWTSLSGLQSFIGAGHKFELAVGGPFEIYFSMEAPEGSRGSEGCKVLSYLPNEMFSFSWNAPPTIPNLRNNNEKTWVVVQFEALEANLTNVKLTHLGWGEGKDWDDCYAYFDQAWDFVLSNLNESVN